MPANTVIIEYLYEIGDTVFYQQPRTQTDVAFKQTTVKTVMITGKRATIAPPSPVLPPATPTPPYPVTIQYDVRFLDGTVKTVTQDELLSGIETVSTIVD